MDSVKDTTDSVKDAMDSVKDTTDSVEDTMDSVKDAMDSVKETSWPESAPVDGENYFFSLCSGNTHLHWVSL